jgi:hypothetical protein
MEVVVWIQLDIGGSSARLEPRGHEFHQISLRHEGLRLYCPLPQGVEDSAVFPGASQAKPLNVCP